jgi:hypothetical protein
MFENTSREIYINKLLQPTEFLVAPFNNLQPEKMSKYTFSNIKFDNNSFSHLKKTTKKEETDKNKFAILSSGGKDSLLSYGFLNEHFDAHPIYVNESGRHWFSAYNAYHRFKTIEPNTAKVWCNSDRIFNWMVKQMPFINPNFQNIRSDQYPIRLWTVSVFLWGVIPLMRKRNIKNIIIGNEYDTTLKVKHEGITHYAGLYDQSKYFDNAYSRYYLSKGWSVNQFSLLRALSELLILKILVKRYPDLQREQVSCHASHKEGDRMLPCGNCEKCRRIVGMLSVLNEDPKRCGYSETQIKNCLKALDTKKVKQFGADAQHLFFLLKKQNLVNLTRDNEKIAKEQKQIMGLRFDNERSKIEDLPQFIRRRLIDAYSEYAEGIFKFEDREWKLIDSKHIDFNQPYIINNQIN